MSLPLSITTGTLDREFVEHVTGPVPAVPALAPAPGAPGPGDNSRLALRGYSTEDVMRVTTALAPPSSHIRSVAVPGVASVGLTLEGLSADDVIAISTAVQQVRSSVDVPRPPFAMPVLSLVPGGGWYLPAPTCGPQQQGLACCSRLTLMPFARDRAYAGVLLLLLLLLVLSITRCFMPPVCTIRS